jgi:hypothetical protein
VADRAHEGGLTFGGVGYLDLQLVRPDADRYSARISKPHHRSNTEYRSISDPPARDRQRMGGGRRLTMPKRTNPDGRPRVIRVGWHFHLLIGVAFLLGEGLVVWLALSQGAPFPIGALFVTAGFMSPLVIWASRMRLEVGEDSLHYVPGLGPRKTLSFQQLAYSDANFLALRIFVAGRRAPLLNIRLIPLSKQDQTWLLTLPEMKLQA